jgi:Tfp pilus assembly protein PilF
MAKVAYLRTIEDEIIDPYYITMDDYCYTLNEDLSKKKDKTYTKKLGHFRNFDSLLERIATHKTNKYSYLSIREYIKQYKEIKELITKFEIKI